MIEELKSIKTEKLDLRKFGVTIGMILFVIAGFLRYLQLVFVNKKGGDPIQILFNDLGHSPQIQEPDRFQQALLNALNTVFSKQSE